MENLYRKSAFVISISFRRVSKVAPADIGEHTIDLFILRTDKEVIKLLSTYTDFEKHHNGDFLYMKAQIMEMKCFVCDITELDLFKKEILWEGKYDSFQWFIDNYPERRIKVLRIPIGIVKRNFNEKFY
jgi:hypothetical protein